MARETQLWQKFARCKPEFGPNLHMNRVENPASPGTPDVEGHLDGQGQFWFELKSEERPAKTETPIRFDIRDTQVAWHTKRWAVGGACYWILQVGSGSLARVYMIAGIAGPSLLKGVTESWLEERTLIPSGKFSPAKAILKAFR